MIRVIGKLSVVGATAIHLKDRGKEPTFCATLKKAERFVVKV